MHKDQISTNVVMWDERYNSYVSMQFNEELDKQIYFEYNSF